MRILDRPAVIALSVASLCLLVDTKLLIQHLHYPIYHFDGPASVLYIPMVLNVCALWLILTGVFVFAQRPGKPRIVIWLGVILFLPWTLLASYCSVRGNALPHLLSLTFFLISLTAYVVLLILWRPSFESHFERIRGFIATLLSFGAISGALILAQLLWFAWCARSLNDPPPLHHSQLGSLNQSPSPRVIWIVLDELSYQQTFEKRYPGLKLPAFDQLASESTVFTHVIPTGIYTQNVIPSLMTGIHVDIIKSSLNGQLSVHNSSSDSWQHFNQHDTIFQDALDDGYSTAVAGWFNPYCRIMPGVLDHCFWTFHESNGMFTSESFLVNLLAPAEGFIERALSFVFFKHAPVSDTRLDTRLHAGDYHSLYGAGDRLLTDRSANFVFLHMPVPHQGGIYNRRTSTFARSPSSYIDNLALADHYLAHVRQVLEQQGTWDSSVIIVMGDHSWRTVLVWRGSPYWTPEDEIASDGGQFDDRPGYIVKMPYQQKAVQIDTPFAALRTRALLDAVINHKISSANDLATWVKQK